MNIWWLLFNAGATALNVGLFAVNLHHGNDGAAIVNAVAAGVCAVCTVVTLVIALDP